MVKESACQCKRGGDKSLIPGSGRSPEGGNGNLLQYSCLVNSMGLKTVGYDSAHMHPEYIKNSYNSVQFSSVAQCCLTLCDPMDCSMPGLPVHRQLPELTQIPCPLNQWCCPTISSSVIPFSSHLQSFPASGAFQMSQLFASGGQNIGVSASASVLPMNIQKWFPLGWTFWISLQSKGFSRVFSNITVQKHQFFSAQFSL